MRYKEEICLTMIEASLLIRDEISKASPLPDYNRYDEWLSASVEVAEMCAKVLDWKVKNSVLGELVSQSFLLFVEEISIEINRVLSIQGDLRLAEYKGRANVYHKKVQNLLNEIYKRLSDEKSIMGINTDISNIDKPIIKASAVLLLAKYWDPALLDPKLTDS